MSVEFASVVHKGFFRSREDRCVDVYPANLLADDSLLCPTDGQESPAWWLAHTLPRQEKVVAAEFFRRGIAFYLPLINRKSITRGRTRAVRIPLFPGYIFLRGTAADRLNAVKTNRLITIHEVPDGECLRKQLKTFSDLIEAGAPLVRESRLVAGDRVRIKTGIFRGVEGVVLRRHGRTELLLAIDFLGQGASLEIEDCGTEPV